MVEVTDAVREAVLEYLTSIVRTHDPESKPVSAVRDDHPALIAFARIYQRGKLEGARLALEAAAKDAEEWFPFDTSKRYPSFGVVASIRALDPAKIVGEG